MKNIAIIGCGNMGLTYAKAFLKYEMVNYDSLLLIEKNKEYAEKLKAQHLGQISSSVNDITSKYEIIILAVKPQDVNSVFEPLSKVLNRNQLVLSIMAGISIEKMEKALNHESIVRAMPNTPAQIGMGITGFAAGKNTKIEHVRKAEQVLSTTGREVFMEDESQLDAVTALSGSGPAYFYYIVKAMIEAGKQMGVEEGMAALLVKQTMLGAYHLMNNSDKTLDELIANVKSKGGTTEAALNKFEEHHLSDIIGTALKAAEARAKELSK